MLICNTFLARFLKHFGSVSAPQIAPKSALGGQVGSKMAPRWTKKPKNGSPKMTSKKEEAQERLNLRNSLGIPPPKPLAKAKGNYLTTKF